MSYTIDLDGQVAVVTGAAQGIGAAIARTLCVAGAQVVVNDVCDDAKAYPLLKELAELGKTPLYARDDISDQQAVNEMFAMIKEKFGRVDILINNAGIVADWDASFAVNAKGSYYCSEAAKPYLAETSGRIVFLTSASIFSGGTGIPQYVATKAGSYALTLFLARTYAPLGIRVNGIAPAVIMSQMLIDRFGTQEAVHAHYKKVMPLGRIGYPKDIAGVALFLVSELSSFICGEILVADGGRMRIG